MIVFHGSYCAIEHPDLSYSRDKLDFGKGFYLTPIRGQAERWCSRYARIGRNAILNVYEFSEEIYLDAAVNVKSFTSYSEEWLDYVFDCRLGKDTYKQYDIVTGGIADDKIFATLDSYFAGYMSKEKALERLAFEKPNHQICILNQTVLDKCLFFKEAITIE